MLLHLRLIMGLAVNRLHLFDQMMLFEGGQGSINRIQGQSGHTPVQSFMQSLRRGMIGGLCQFSINLQPLMGQFEIGCPAGLLKGFHLMLYGMI